MNLQWHSQASVKNPQGGLSQKYIDISQRMQQIALEEKYFKNWLEIS